MSKKMTVGRIVLLCVFGILAISIARCQWASHPQSVHRVIRVLNRYTESQQFTHIATISERDEHNRRMNTYTFADRDGLLFTVVSRVGSNDLMLPIHAQLRSDYLIVRARADREHIAALLGQTGLYVEVTDDGGDSRNSLRFIIIVHSYADLENAAWAIENTQNSIDRILSREYSATSFRNDINFPLPSIFVRHADGAPVTSVRLWQIGRPAQRSVFDLLHDRYLDAIRDGGINEDLPYEIWWRSPRHIFNIFFDGEMIRGGQQRLNNSMSYIFFDSRLGEYKVWAFGSHSILTWYVNEMGGTYDFDEFEATWTIGGDTWVVTMYHETIEHPRDPQRPGPIRTTYTVIEQITKNGESLGIYRTQMTLPIFAQMLGLEFEIDQTVAAVFFRSC